MKSKKDVKNGEFIFPPLETNNNIFVFSKGVKENVVRHSVIDRTSDVNKIIEVISKLPTGSLKKFDDINLNTNPKKWIKNLLENYSQPENEKMEELINDFTDSMKTRMREDEKYVIGLLWKNELLLAHSYFGEKTITPEWKVIPRMLDFDNVMRYVLFQRESDENISVKYFEKYSTDSFVDWLGLPQKDALYHFGGKYRISTEVDGVINTLEIPIEKIDTWVNEHDEIKNSEIELPTPINKLKIVQIRVGRKKYDKPRDFLQDFYAEKYNINYYRKKFKEIQSSVNPYIYKFFDEKGQVIMIEGDNTVSVVKKTNPHFDVLFCCNLISIRDNYLDDIYRKFQNEENIRIYHAGHNFSHQPLIINNMEIWNEIKTSTIFSSIKDYYDNINLQDKNITQIFEVILFFLLKSENEAKHISTFFTELSNKILENTRITTNFAKLEDGIIEYKASDYFTGQNKDIINRISSDLKKKFDTNSTKVYLIGVNDDGSLDPIPNGRLASDRVNSIQENIKQSSQANVLHLFTVKCQNDKSIVILIGGK